MPERNVVKYNLPRPMTDMINTLARNHRVRASAVAEALIAASAERIAAGLDVITTHPPRVTPAPQTPPRQEPRNEDQ